MGQFSVDVSLRLAEVLAVVIGVVKIVRVLSRMEEIFREFPPHRHINGTILYPKGFDPGVQESLKVSGAATGK